MLNAIKQFFGINQKSGTNGTVLSTTPNTSTQPHHGGRNHGNRHLHTGSGQRKHVAVGSIHVTVIKGDFYNEKADVIINMAAPDMDLNKGGSSHALLQAAGPHVQSQCYNIHPRGNRVKEGTLVVTGSGKLQCKKIYHVVLPTWKKHNSGVLSSVIETCLETAEKYNVKTIVCPDLGTGFHGFPADVSAAALFQGILDFISKYGQTSIATVTFVVQASRQAQFNAFESEAKKRHRLFRGGGPSQQHTVIGNLSVSVVTGNLCNQQVDIIVSNTGSDLKLKNGGLSESLLQVAGNGLQTECDNNFPTGIKPGDVAVTYGYNLKCERVYHSALPTWDPVSKPTQDLEHFVSSCLIKADHHNSKSIAFPTLGTGSLNYPADVAAHSMCQCIKSFQIAHPSTKTNDIRIVIYDKSSNCSLVKQAFLKNLKTLSTQPSSVRTTPQNPQSAAAQPQPIPKRGTQAFFKHKYMEELCPPNYWTKYSNKKTLKQWNLEQCSRQSYDTVPVDQSTQDAVSQLVESTWQQSLKGHGCDAKGLDTLNFTKLLVKNVKRIENPVLFEKYAQERAQLFSKASSSGQFTEIGKITASKGSIFTTSKVILSNLTADIFPEINEHYLFHGTDDSKINAIMNDGFDPRLAGQNAMLGHGVYCAESSTKSDQYADPANKRTLKNKKMILVRMCLGEIYVMTTATKLKRPPCKHCQKDTCNTHNRFFDSVVLDGKLIFREFIVYDQRRCYPEYLITYDRV